WLVKNRAERVGPALRRVQTIAILSEEQLLEVMTLPIPPHGLLLRGPTGHLPVDRLALSLEGYIAGPGRLLGHLSRNLHRLQILDRFTPEELRILGLLGAGLQNRAIADLTGLAESRVKTVTHTLTHKLRMENRTAVAVFAATNGLSSKTGPGPPRQKPA
ncbi:MAG: LuxR C-terminal-related transcriptional regulator, partial [Proteobacteria bacterium]|nr:LuxR C-terminal-related transcriptional regulator [Pseudomonadota bacterium]